MRRYWTLVAVVAVLASSLLPAPAQETMPSQDAWGYVYAFRTLRAFPLTGEDGMIGRLPENQVVLTSPLVSRRHAVIRRTDSGIELVDVGSTNGSRVNGRELRPRFPVRLSPGDRIQLADELLLFHESLPELWWDELQHRLLASLIKLRLHLPQDHTRSSFGREEIVPAVTDAVVNAESGKIEIEHSVEVEPTSGFPEESGAFVGHVEVDDGTLELSLWSVASESSMTSRRASFTNLKHTTLRISVPGELPDGSGEPGDQGPWFRSNYLNPLFEVFPDDRELSLQFSHSLANQDRPVALRDAAATFAFRHRLTPDDWQLLLLAAQSKGLWVERWASERRMRLTDLEKARLAEAVEQARAWLEAARELGAETEPVREAEAAIGRAAERLASVE